MIWKKRPKQGLIEWVPYTREFAPEHPSRPYPTIWADLDTTRQTKAHQKQLFGELNIFDTPKPEDLCSGFSIYRQHRGDLVLDSFAGSGTTGAVAHKMGRRWIMVELGEHCHTHIIPRLKRSSTAQDPGGITEAVGWKGGGGFRYFRLAPSLLEKDGGATGSSSSEYNAAMLAEAMCKLEGFHLRAERDDYWQHGQSTERDFIYVTTQTLTKAQLDQISATKSDRAHAADLLRRFARQSLTTWHNLTVKKIPQAVLSQVRMGPG